MSTVGELRQARIEQLETLSTDALREICEGNGIRWQPSNSEADLVEAIARHEYGARGTRAQDRYDELKKWGVKELTDLATELKAIPSETEFRGTKGDLIARILIAERNAGTVQGYVKNQLGRPDATLEFSVEPGSQLTPFAERSAVLEWLLEVGVPDWLAGFAKDNADYGDQHAVFGLGPRAEFIGMWRKIWKLKRAVWDRKPMQGEDVDEMLGDLIASAFLMLHLRAIERGDAKQPQP